MTGLGGTDYSWTWSSASRFIHAHHDELSRQLGFDPTVPGEVDHRTTALTTLLDNYRHRARIVQRPAGRTKFCPACLAEDGILRSVWTSPLSVVCLTHPRIPAPDVPGMCPKALQQHVVGGAISGTRGLHRSA